MAEEFRDSDARFWRLRQLYLWSFKFDDTAINQGWTRRQGFPLQQEQPGVMSGWRRTTFNRADGHDWSNRLAQHARWLRTVIANRSGDWQATDEIFQEIALAAVTQAPNVPEERVAPWLYRLAVRQSLMHRRRLGRQRKLQHRLAAAQSDVADVSEDPLVWLLSDERQKLVRMAIGQMHVKDAEMLLLKYTEDWSYHDLAAHLGISHSAVETRLYRARQKLRDALIAMEVVEPMP